MDDCHSRIEGLLSRHLVLETLGSFDPFTMGMHFSERYIDTESSAQWRRRLDEAASEQGVDGAVSTFLSGIPSPLLAHEASHLWQAMGTNWGIRDFYEYWRSTALLLDLAHAVHSADGTTLRVAIASDESLASDQLVSRHLRELDERLNSLAIAGGGSALPWGSVEQMASDYSSNVASVIGYRPDNLPVHFVNVLGSEKDEKIGVLLGTIHLYEGYGALVEEIRASFSKSGSDREFLTQVSSHPFHPYHVLSHLYKGIVPDRLDSTLEFLEFAALIDAALMCCGLHSSLVQNGSFDENTTPTDVILNMLEVMQSDPTMRLEHMSPEAVKRFQEVLLGAIGAPVQTMSELTEIAAETMSSVLAIASETFPMIHHQREKWLRASRLALSYRQKVGGACPVMALAICPRLVLDEIASSAGARIQIGPNWITDSHTSAAGKQLFILAMFSTLRHNLLDMAFGSRTCLWNENCLLPRREACQGVTSILVAPGSRCAREGSIVSIVHALNTNSETPGSLGFTARSKRRHE